MLNLNAQKQGIEGLVRNHLMLGGSGDFIPGSMTSGLRGTDCKESRIQKMGRSFRASMVEETEGTW